MVRGIFELTGPSWGLKLNDWSTERTGLDVVEVELRLPRYSKSSPALRIALLTDLHAGPSTGDGIFARAAQVCCDWQPDLMLWGGDYVLFEGIHAERLTPLLTAVRPKLGSYAVWGNHDWASGRAPISRVFDRCGIRLLVNESIVLPAPYDAVTVVGLDDAGLGAIDCFAAWQGVRKEDFVLLLCHNPDSLLDLGGHRPDLSLSGHTHGGQIVLPGGVAPYVPSRIARQQPAGLRQTPSGPLYISRGIGCTAVPVRVNAPPELTLLTITSP